MIVPFASSTSSNEWSYEEDAAGDEHGAILGISASTVFRCRDASVDIRSLLIGSYSEEVFVSLGVADLNANHAVCTAGLGGSTPASMYSVELWEIPAEEELDSVLAPPSMALVFEAFRVDGSWAACARVDFGDDSSDCLGSFGTSGTHANWTVPLSGVATMHDGTQRAYSFEGRFVAPEGRAESSVRDDLDAPFERGLITVRDQARAAPLTL